LAKSACSEKVDPGSWLFFFRITLAQSRMNYRTNDDQNAGAVMPNSYKSAPTDHVTEATSNQAVQT
jgi:hypothetical protein